MTSNQFQRPQGARRLRNVIKRPSVDELPLPDPIVWADVFAAEPNRDLALGEWCPEGRATAIYSQAKQGKTTLVLHDVYEALAERVVTYLDNEMAIDDLREILGDLGARESDLVNLRYYLYAALPPLDRRGGGEFLVRLCQRDGSNLVVFDTGKRFVEGDENENDTWQRFWTYTGSVLKQAGITWVRIAHAGKDPRRGQRGGSSLNDDVDVVWELSRTDAGTKLRRMFSRVSWLPEEIVYVRETEPRLRFLQVVSGLPAGTLEVAALLDRLGAPIDVSRRAAAKLVREQGHHSARNEIISAAVKHRKHLAESADEDALIPASERSPISGTTRSEGTGTTSGDHRGPPKETPGSPTGPLRGPPGTMLHSDCGGGVPPIGGTTPHTGAGPEGLAASIAPGMSASAGCRNHRPPSRTKRRHLSE